MVLQPGGVWVIERALPDTEEHAENLQTCLMRGWVEILQESVPTGKLNSDGTLPNGPMFENKKHLYRLTDSGWNALHRTHQLSVLGIAVALIAVAIAL